VVKNQHALYLPSKRVPDAWVKLKPEYLDHIATDLDLLIIGTAGLSPHSGGPRMGGRSSCAHYFSCLYVCWPGRTGKKNRRLL
jgi:hypothetical protein